MCFLSAGLGLVPLGCKDSATPGAPAPGNAGFSSAAQSPPPPPAAAAPTSPPPPSLPGCTGVSSCPPVRPDVLSMTANAQLVGVSGQPVNWMFYGRDLNTLNSTQLSSGFQGSQRRVTLIFSNLPLGAQLSPAVNGTALYTQESIVWTPSAAASGTIQMELRDYDRCMVTEANAAVTCNAPGHTVYDLAATVPWQIVQPPPARAAAPASGPATAGQAIGGIIGTFVGSLLGNLAKASDKYSYSSQAQVYPDCKTNDGSGYGCNWQCGTLWCSKDDASLSDASTCTVTKAGGPSC